MPRPLLVCLLLAVAPAPLPAQESLPGPISVAPSDARLARGDSAHAAHDVEAALGIFEALLEERPEHYPTLWRAAREAVNLAMLAKEGDQRKAWSEAAVDYARRAEAVDGGRTEGREWLAIALGRLALEEGPKTRVRLAVEIRAVALDILDSDPDNVGAHHVLGEWHAEIRRLSGIERWAARKLLGADVFEEASWDRALHHLERAAELDLRGLIHHLALARAYQDLDRPEEARSRLIEVLRRPAIEPADHLHQEEARRLLVSG